MAHGGARKGAGRKPGGRNGFTRARAEQVEAAAAMIEAALPKAFTGDAHALLMAVYKDTTQPIDLRIDAAKAAVRFEKPMLSAVEAKVAMTVEDLDEAALNREIAQAAAAAGLISGGSTH